MVMRRMILGLVLCCVLMGCQAARPHADEVTLYQVSTLQALMEGAYDGVETCGELRRHGSMGIGTFDSLDGEMVLLDGTVYQVQSSGRVVMPADSTLVPFADVADFRPEGPPRTVRAESLAELSKGLDEAIGTKNIFYMVRLDGRFHHVKTRSVPRQRPPYPRLSEATKTQSVFEFDDIEGTIIALRCPEYAKGINMPGWHMHFISRGRTHGGHLLEVSASELTARICPVRMFEMQLPARGRFVQADLAKDLSEEIHKAEK